VVIVPVPDWASGLSASVRAALAAADEAGSLAAVLIPVDTPVSRRRRWHASPPAPTAPRCAAPSTGTLRDIPS
jgi:CTP:molybdopterin cytidylyltransferase MocA